MGIRFVPTSHVARQSVESIRKALEKKPDCVAVELDPLRYQAMISEERGSSMGVIRSLGIFTFLIYWVMRNLQQRLGKMTGIFPGTEMLEAVRIAKREGIPVAFIDQNIELTMLGFRNLPFTEKLKIFWLLIVGVAGMAIPLGRKKDGIDLNRLPPQRLIDAALAYLKKELPGLYDVLIDQRNRVMVQNLRRLNERFEDIVCVIGAGHEKGMRKILE